MNIKPCLKYQMNEHLKAIGVYWLVVLIITLVMACAFSIFFTGGVGELDDVSVNGFDFSVCIVLLVTGLVTFYSGFGMMLQFGATRASLFISRVITTVAICAIVVMLNRLFQAGITFVFIKALNVPNNISLGNMMDEWFRELYYSGAASTPAVFAQSMLWEYGIYMMIMAGSNFLSVLYYRLNKIGKISLSAGFPVLVFIIIPAIDLKFLNGRVTEFAVKLFLNAFGFMPMNAAVTITAFLVTFAVFSAATWLLMRRANLQKK